MGLSVKDFMVDLKNRNLLDFIFQKVYNGAMLITITTSEYFAVKNTKCLPVVISKKQRKVSH